MGGGFYRRLPGTVSSVVQDGGAAGIYCRADDRTSCGEYGGDVDTRAARRDCGDAIDGISVAHDFVAAAGGVFDHRTDWRGYRMRLGVCASESILSRQCGRTAGYDPDAAVDFSRDADRGCIDRTVQCDGAGELGGAAEYCGCAE